VRKLFESDDWETHLQGLRLRLDKSGKKRIHSLPLLDVIQRFPKLAGEIFFKLMTVRLGTEKFISYEERQFDTFDSVIGSPIFSDTSVSYCFHQN